MDKEAKLLEKKKIILDALKRCLMRDVYSKITVQDIATEAGFSKGGLLHYFQTKEDIYLELVNNLFHEIESDQNQVLEGNLHINEKAGISALFGVEKFLMEPQTIRILLNLFLYSLEEEKIMKEIRSFLQNHLKVYEAIIEETNKKLDNNLFKAKQIARIAQIVLISAGIFEAIDPIDLDPMSLVKHVVSLIKG